MDGGNTVTPTYAGVPVPGLREFGNLDLSSRPTVPNPEGGVSTVYSMSFGNDRGEILIPRVSNGEDGRPPRILGEKEAIDYFKKYGGHLGVFKDPESADRYAQTLHEDQARGNRRVPDPNLFQQNQQVQQNLNATPPPTAPTPEMSAGQPAMPDMGASNPNVVPHTSLMGQIAKTLLGHTTSYSVDQNGNTVASQSAQKPGSFFRNVLAAAILGGAAADDAHTKNPQAGFMSGMLHGAGAEMGDQRAQDLQKQQQARLEFKQRNEANEEQRRQQGFATEEQLRKAQIAQANLETLKINQLLQGQSFDLHVREADRGKAQLKPYEDAGLQPVASDIPESEKTQFVKDHPGAGSWLWAHTGVKHSLDANGNPTYEATLTAFDPKEGITVTPEYAKQLEDDGLFVRYPEFKDVVKPGKKLTAQQSIAIAGLQNKVYSDKENRLRNNQTAEEVKARIRQQNASASAALASAYKSNLEAGEIKDGKNQQQALNKALKALDAAGGDISKLDPSERILIGESGNRILGNLTTAYRAAVQNMDDATARSLLGQIQSISTLTTNAMTGVGGSNTGTPVTYTWNGQTFNLPPDKVAGFLQTHQGATLSSGSNTGSPSAPTFTSSRIDDYEKKLKGKTKTYDDLLRDAAELGHDEKVELARRLGIPWNPKVEKVKQDISMMEPAVY